MSDVPSVRRYG